MKSVAGNAGRYNLVGGRGVAGMTLPAVADVRERDFGAGMRLRDIVAIGALEIAGAVAAMVEPRLGEPRHLNMHWRDDPRRLHPRLPCRHGLGDLVTNDANALFEQVF